jgi:radical SAM superfamily enzyme YgiQ (UPF0313 family)
MKKALMLYPEFSSNGFWNYKDVCRLIDAKHPTAPLGIITVAALLPQEWDIRLCDMNTRELKDKEIDWADIVFISGMLPQQMHFLRLMKRVHARGKKVVCGGPDPTSQPDVYKDADYLVLGEAEDTIHAFLTDLDNGVEKGIYRPGTIKPCMTDSPVPRYDLLNFNDYMMIGTQFSRGCPFNCEFCDIIELYGRKTRTKSPQQVLKELDVLYNLGYRGHLDFVDDNFIGNKALTMEILRAVEVWSREHDYPFFFSTAASINLADHEDLLELMKSIDVRYVFIGIESTDDEILKDNNKHQNRNRNLYDCLHKIYSYGIIVTGGFIIGFDNETSASARAIIDTISLGKICMSMVGLLYALPNTQLTRRLKSEKRYIENSGTTSENGGDFGDQASDGLNFVTKRPLQDIIKDYVHVLRNVYSRKSYFDKCLAICRVLKITKKHKIPFMKKLQMGVAFFRLAFKLGIRLDTFYYFWRNLIKILFIRPSNMESVASLMAMYIHFRKQTKYIVDLMTDRMKKMAASPVS